MYFVLSILAILSTAALASPHPTLSLLFLAALGAANASPHPDGSTSPHPDGSSTGAPKINLVYVLLDDWGWANWGVHNPKNPEIVTPNLDALLAEGIELDRHYVVRVPTVSHLFFPFPCALSSSPAILFLPSTSINIAPPLVVPYNLVEMPSMLTC